MGQILDWSLLNFKCIILGMLYVQLPRAVNTQALSGAGFLKMINKASDAVNKMTIKMNESDTVRAEKSAEVFSFYIPFHMWPPNVNLHKDE